MRRAHVLEIALIGSVLAAAPRVAAADPVHFRFKSAVAIGEKPTLEIAADEAIGGLEIVFERADHKQFAVKKPALAAGQTVVVPIGDGAAGKAQWTATVTATPKAGAPWKTTLTFETAVRAPIKVTYDVEHLDLDKHVLEVKTSRAVDRAELVAIGEDGARLGTGAATWTGEPATAWHAITWTPARADARVLRLELRVTADDGAAVAVELVPWSVTVAHEDVTFRTDSAAIDPDEAKKLDASAAAIADTLARTAKVMPARLYVAGHTDTVGPSAKNRTLSTARAKAIAEYLRKKGIAIPIAYAGFGEDVLKVPTPDDKDEPANRRADYVLGPAAGQPPFRGAYLRAKAAWHELK